MSSFLCLNKLILNIKHIVFYLIYKYGSDKLYLRFYFHSCMGYWMDFKHPKTFNEKLQWLKLYDRKPIYTTMVDKYAVKEYVAGIIGKQYIIPTLGVWNTFEEIDFKSLPNQFVLKCTHDSGTVIVCKDKSYFDIEKARCNLSQALETDFYKKTREWPYKNVPHRIIAEQYIEDSTTHDLHDYKYFCFNGKVKAMFIASDRQNDKEDTKFDFFDENFNHLDVENGHPMSTVLPSKPVCFDEMKSLAERLSIRIPHVRVDFFEVDGKVYFGEMTFFHWSGTVPFKPSNWDEVFGAYIELPPKNKL